jgi:hypothetical protein
MDWSSLTGKIALIGNGPVKEDWSEAVDGCDHVFRFNFCTTDCARTGNRTDYLVINNVGRPAFEMLTRALPSCADGAEIVFGRNVETHFDYYERCGFDKYRLSLVSTEAAMVRCLGPRRWGRVDAGDYNQVFRRLIDLDGRADFLMPSLGFATLEIILTRRPEAVVHLVGFTFEGWKGHPWEKERLLAERYERADRVRFWR